MVFNGKQNPSDFFACNVFGWNTFSGIFFYYPFTIFLFKFIIFFRWRVNVFVIFFIFVFIAQVSCTTISVTWRIVKFTCLLIITTNVVLPILKWLRSFLQILFFHQWYCSLFFGGLSGSWIFSFSVMNVSFIYFFKYYDWYVLCLAIQLLYLLHI